MRAKSRMLILKCLFLWFFKNKTGSVYFPRSAQINNFWVPPIQLWPFADLNTEKINLSISSSGSAVVQSACYCAKGIVLRVAGSILAPTIVELLWLKISYVWDNWGSNLVVTVPWTNSLIGRDFLIPDVWLWPLENSRKTAQ